MTPYSENYEEIRSYLLGTLSEEDRQRTEERLFTDSEFLEELLICEEELIDDYINDDLSAESRLKFEQHFLCTPERQEKIKFAFAFRRYTSQKPVPLPTPPKVFWLKAFLGGQTPAFRFAMAVVVIAIVGIGVRYFWPVMFRPPTIATITISRSSGVRAEGSRSEPVRLTPDVDALKILLTLPEVHGPSSELRVEWLNDQRTAKSWPIQETGDKTLTVVIPAKELARGQHSLRLYTLNSDGSMQRINGDYFFTIE